MRDPRIYTTTKFGARRVRAKLGVGVSFGGAPKYTPTAVYTKFRPESPHSKFGGGGDEYPRVPHDSREGAVYSKVFGNRLISVVAPYRARTGRKNKISEKLRAPIFQNFRNSENREKIVGS